MNAFLVLVGLLLGWLLITLGVATGFRRPARWQRYPILAGLKANPRAVLVTGATGFIGQRLCRQIIQSGDELLVLTRNYSRAWNLYGPHARICTSLEQIVASSRIGAIVNLAGEPIFASRWTANRRRVLLESRLNVTQALIDLIARLQIKPRVLVSMSAVGYYGLRGDEELTEIDRGRPVFQSQLCQTWELAAQKAGNYGVRVCRLRLGVVLGRDGGALARLLASARMRLCTVLGSGRQWLSWIHIDDAVRLIEHCMECEEIAGPVNATAPVPVRQTEFAQALSGRFGKSLRIRLPRPLLQRALGEMAELLIDGQRVLPLKAACTGFEFRYTNVVDALTDLTARESEDEAMSGSHTDEVLYDALCPICDAEMTSYCRTARRAGLRWRFTDVSARAELMARYGLDLITARKRVYVVNDAGRMISGIDALTTIWAGLPGWRVLAGFIGLPGIKSLAAGFYDLILAPLIWSWNQRRRTDAALD